MFKIEEKVDYLRFLQGIQEHPKRIDSGSLRVCFSCSTNTPASTGYTAAIPNSGITGSALTVQLWFCKLLMIGIFADLCSKEERRKKPEERPVAALLVSSIAYCLN